MSTNSNRSEITAPTQLFRALAALTNFKKYVASFLKNDPRPRKYLIPTPHQSQMIISILASLFQLT